jgi:hypothetical protein
VGKDENSLALMRCAGFGSSYAVPPRIEPHLGQAAENSAESSPSVAGDVLQQDDGWS